jgi:hypothetical protein
MYMLIFYVLLYEDDLKAQIEICILVAIKQNKNTIYIYTHL